MKLRAIGSPKIGSQSSSSEVTSGDVLGELVPDQPVAGDAGGIEQPDDRQAGEPGEPAHAAIVVIGELAQQVDHQHDDHQVGGVAMEAAHHAGVVPMLLRQVLDRLVGALDAGIEEDEQIDAADGDDPEEEEAERTELGERVERRAEQPVERPLEYSKPMRSTRERTDTVSSNGADHARAAAAPLAQR